MAHHCYRAKMSKVRIPMAQNRMYVHNLKQGDQLMMPPGCTVMDEPERLPDELFQKIEFMPTDFKRLPYAFNVPEHPKEADIQKILHYSLKQQKDDDVAYSSGFVCKVIKECLDAINVPCSLVMGYRKIDKDASPVVWLDIDGVVIDNSYEKYLTKRQIASLEKSTPKCYEPRQSFKFTAKCSVDDYSGEIEEFPMTCIKKGLQIFMQEPDKGIALGLNQEPLYLYYFAMIRFMFESFNVHLKCIDPAVRHYCWGCSIFPMHSTMLLTEILPEGYSEVSEDSTDKIKGKFKHCNRCMVSNYCSTECHEKDWKRQHKYVCVSCVAGPASEY